MTINMKSTIKTTMSMVLKLMCAIAVIASIAGIDAQAWAAPKAKKAKTTRVKKARKHRKSKTGKKVTQLTIVEDERAIGTLNQEKCNELNTVREIPEFPTKMENWEVVEAPREKTEALIEEPKKEVPRNDKEEVFYSTHQMPMFPGGDGALMKYLEKNIHYPMSAKDNAIQGKVIVQFVVEKDGSIGEVKVARSVDRDLDREAIRLCKSLPKFSPGRNANGEPVRVWYTLPVTFKLHGLK